MATSERIRYFRKKRGMTQKYLGIEAGLPQVSAEVRITQYETTGRSPRPDLTERIADVLNVSPLALNVPDIDTDLGLIHTLFALEDMYGLKITEIDGAPCLRINLHHDPSPISLFRMFNAWLEQSKKLESGEITKEEYDQWRYRFPEYADPSKTGFHKVETFDDK